MIPDNSYLVKVCWKCWPHNTWILKAKEKHALLPAFAMYLCGMTRCAHSKTMSEGSQN